MNAKIYGDFAVKFRAFGVDFGYVRKSISAQNAVEFVSPIVLAATIPISFEKFGIKVNAYLSRA